MKQDLVAALGVTISSAEHIAASLRSGAPIYNEYVSVPGLRAALEKLPVVEGKISFVGTPDNPQAYTKFEVVDKHLCTHTARLLAIEEIKKEPVKVKVIYSNYTPLEAGIQIVQLLDKQLKGKPFKIIVEEIVGNGEGL